MKKFIESMEQGFGDVFCWYLLLFMKMWDNKIGRIFLALYLILGTLFCLYIDWLMARAIFHIR